MTAGLFLSFGILLGAALFWLYHRYKSGTFQKLAAEILQKVEHEAEGLRHTAEMERKQKLLDLQKSFEEAWHKERRKIQTAESRLKEKEDNVERRMTSLEKKLAKIEKRETDLARKSKQLDEEISILQEEKGELRRQWETIGGMTSKEAREKLSEELQSDVKQELANYIKKKTEAAEESVERKAKRLLASAIHRLAVPCVSEVTVNTVALPSEEIKGRIIGREGRNIRALEKMTGVSLMIDDTPGAVVLSAFDPIRLHIAKQALTELISDGRIHPTRIEEVVENAKVKISKRIKEIGEDAAIRAGQANLHPDLVELLGKLKFRYSCGQNVLDHSLEVSYLMGMVASEMHLDVSLAKRIGLLHDIGKAVSHEVEGTHAMIGHDLALKCGESKEVANGIGCHHNELQPLTIEASFCKDMDAISASRPGARIEALGEYVKRVQRLEKVAYEFEGVEKAYALQAGKELSIVVLPEVIDDHGMASLARDLAKRIEKELRYPGKIKVTVHRERRAVAYAI